MRTSITTWKKIEFWKDAPRKPTLPIFSNIYHSPQLENSVTLELTPPPLLFSPIPHIPIFFNHVPPPSPMPISPLPHIIGFQLKPISFLNYSPFPAVSVTTSGESYTTVSSCHPCVSHHYVSWFIQCILGPFRLTHGLQNLIKLMSPRNSFFT